MKAAYLEQRILATILLVSCAANMAHASLVAHWKLDEEVGRTAADASGNGNDGELVGEAKWAPGYDNQALALGGVGDYVDLGNPQDWPSGVTPRSMCAWAKTDSVGTGYRCIAAYGAIGKGRAMFIGQVSGDLIGGGYMDDLVKSDFWEVGVWHHVCLTYDGTTARLYADGAEQVSAKSQWDLRLKRAHIGRQINDKAQFWSGMVDDVRLYDHALSAAEVAQLAIGRRFFPPSDMLTRAIQRSEEVLKAQGPQKALLFLEKEIAKYKQWTKEDATGYSQKRISSDLYFHLAKAEEAAGTAKEDITCAYKRAIQSAGLDPVREGAILLWLHKNASGKEFDAVVESLIEQDSMFVRSVARMARSMIQEDRLEAAGEFLEWNLAAYANWRDEHPLDETAAEGALPEAYFQLAKAREASGASDEDLTEAYVATFSPSRWSYARERAAALAWLVERGSPDACAKAIRSFTQDRDVRICFKDIVAQVCKRLEEEKDWPKSQRFLDVLFAEAKYPGNWAVYVDSCVSNKAGPWGKAYEAYLESHPRIKFHMDETMAEQHVADEEFTEAADLYRRLLARCEPEDDRGAFHAELCKCLFRGGKCREAITEIDDFVARSKATHRPLVKDAMILKGRAHIQLGEFDDALNTFLSVIVEYPEAKETAETAFMLGHCHMLLSRFEDAKAALNIVIRDYPETTYADKARLTLTRIETMSN